MTDQITSQESDPVTAETNNSRNPLILFVGFLLLGFALAIVLFGRDLFGSSQNTVPVPNDSDETTVLDQVIEFPTAESSVAEIPASNPSGILEVGEKAFNFTLLDLDGNPVSLSDLEGRPVIINFWATWCAPCRIEMPELQEAYDAYQDEELAILALNQDEPADLAREYFVDEMGLTFTALLDDNSAISIAFGTFGLPTTFFIDAEGTITAIHRGPMTLEQIEGYLEETIAG
jgi:peroxiredoxin